MFDFKSLVVFISEQWATIVAITSLVTPIVISVVYWMFKERLEEAKARIPKASQHSEWESHEGINTGSVPNLQGSVWEGYSPKHPESGITSRLEISQSGNMIRANIQRRVSDGEREFLYEGKIIGGDILLTWEEIDGAGYIVGAMVLHLVHDLKRLEGRSTYYSHKHGEVISSKRLYKRVK